VAYETPELERGPALEPRPSSTSWLEAHRTQVAIWAAVAEGLLVLVGAVPKYAAIIIAALVLVGYFFVARGLKWGFTRRVAWVVAVSQAFVLLVPVLAIVVGTLALVAVGFIAVVALVLLFTERG
jgi:hypothetical protein